MVLLQRGEGKQLAGQARAARQACACRARDAGRCRRRLGAPCAFLQAPTTSKRTCSTQFASSSLMTGIMPQEICHYLAAGAAAASARPAAPAAAQQTATTSPCAVWDPIKVAQDKECTITNPNSSGLSYKSIRDQTGLLEFKCAAATCWRPARSCHGWCMCGAGPL